MERRYIFSDGTAFFGEHVQYTFAGAAVIECNPDTWDTVLIDRGPTPGLTQNSYMGEVSGILRALQKVWCMDLHMDCQAAIDILQQALQAAKCGTGFGYDTDFLWDDTGNTFVQDRRVAYEFLNVQLINVGKSLSIHNKGGWHLRMNKLIQRLKEVF